jgi:His-Xaa-Ser system protein HxsD
MENESKILDRTIIIYLETALYSKDSIFKCLYWYSDKFDIVTNTVVEKYYEIKFKPNTTTCINDNDLEKYFNDLKRDFIDFNLRDIVTKETKNIRELLIAKAFSNYEDEEITKDEI